MKKQRILWICNQLMPEYRDFIGVSRAHTGGWLIGMRNKLIKTSMVRLAICQGVRDDDKRIDAVINDVAYYSFTGTKDGIDIGVQKNELINIIDDFEPDVIHIWGTEDQHSLAMVEACEEKEVLSRVLVSTQGMMGKYRMAFDYRLPQFVLSGKIYDAYNWFVRGEIQEKEIISRVSNVSGRTEWDKAIINQINPNCKYYYCGEILRDYFYDTKYKWTSNHCEKFSIFMSQAASPIKGLHTVIESLSNLSKKYPQMRVYISGSNIYEKKDEYQEWLTGLISKYQLESVIVPLGAFDEQRMYNQYLKANVFLSASVIENSPNSICEAMMIGTPVVASYVGGISSMIRHGDNGFVYPLMEPYMMEHYISMIFEMDRNRLEAMSLSGKRFVEQFNNRDNAMETILKIYQEVEKNCNDIGDNALT